MDSQRTCALLLAAGGSRRMGGGANKVFLELASGSVISHPLRAFQSSTLVDAVFTAVRGDDRGQMARVIELCGASKALDRIVEGGRERYHSVLNGLEAMASGTPPDIVLIHDGARPFLSVGMIRESIDAASRYGAVVMGYPMVDTAKEVDGGKPCPRAERTLDRRRLWQVQTPQTFRFPLILEAYRGWDASKGIPTDDTALVEAMGRPVHLVAGPRYNLKITTEADLRVARAMVAEGVWKP